VSEIVEGLVLVCADYVLTLDEERLSLPEVLGSRIPEGQSGRLEG
jgi:hypothetical protein